MEDFDVFTNEITFTKPVINNILNKYVNEIPQTPFSANYQSGRRLLADECLSNGNELECAFQISEAVSAWPRTIAVYKEEQAKSMSNKMLKMTSHIKPLKEFIKANPISKDDEEILNNFIGPSGDDITNILDSVQLEDDLPFYRKYLRFTPENNSTNLQKILKELPKEWTIIQLTATYNPNESLKQYNEYRMEINSMYLTLLSNDYLDLCDYGPMTLKIPANITKEGEKPLFPELYSLLEDNYKTIDNAQSLNNKRLIQNYWNRREDIDLRMKSVINKMDKDWLGGWGSLLTGKLVDTTLRDKVIARVDHAITDWGFIKLTQKQRILLYNLVESSVNIPSAQVRTCIRRILTENGNPDDIRRVLNSNTCQSQSRKCSKKFRFTNELCSKCLALCFELVHNFTLADGVRAFSQVVVEIKDGDDWAALKKAKRLPVILIVDELLDTFPWECLPILNHHPVTRIENVHFLYYLYKIHEDKVQGGYFRAKTDVGRYVINPEKNLDRMEKRMSSFVKFWCESWSGHIGEPPPPDTFLDYLTSADLFLYCGHGDGCHLGGAGVDVCTTRAVVLLAGCGSVRLVQAPGRSPPQAAHHRLHIAGCPMVVGMLWEVTDLEVDKMVSTLISIYTPSEQPAWATVGKKDWSQGVLDTNTESKTPAPFEPDLLKAVVRSRGSTNYAMIASSMVARGLPVLLDKPS